MKSSGMGMNLFDVIRRNSARQVKLVLEAGCDVNAREEGDGTSALMEAVLLPEGGRALVVRLLLDAGADPGVRNKDGLTALTLASILDRQDAILMMLQADGLQLDAVDKHGNSALMYACALGSAEVVRLLVNAAANGGHVLDLQRSNNDGLTAADLAAHNGHTQLADVIARLISAEAGEEASDVTHQTRPCDDSSLKRVQNVIEKVRARAQNIERTCGGSAKFPTNPRRSPGLGSTSPTGRTSRGDRPARPKSRARSLDSRASSRASNAASEHRGAGGKGKGGGSRFMGEELEEDDLSLQSLGELVSNMRECAREIREICAPLQPGDPRGVPYQGPNTSSSSKSSSKKSSNKGKQSRGKKPKITLTATFDSSSGKAKLNIPTGTSTLSPDAAGGSEADPHGDSRGVTPVPRGDLAAPPRLAPTLRVENETLSKSWPRSRSKSRALSNSFNGSSSSHAVGDSITPTPTTGPTPRRRKPLPQKDLAQSCQAEKEILNKLFSKMSGPQGDEAAGEHPAPNPLPQGRDPWSPFGAPLPSISASEHESHYP